MTTEVFNENANDTPQSKENSGVLNGIKNGIKGAFERTTGFVGEKSTAVSEFAKDKIIDPIADAPENASDAIVKKVIDALVSLFKSVSVKVFGSGKFSGWINNNLDSAAQYMKHHVDPEDEPASLAEKQENNQSAPKPDMNG